MSIAQLPELVALDIGGEGVRIPPGDTVPLTPRVRALLDTPPLRRLARISQLGLVALVYPGAVHSRLEHSLGVYRLALEFLRRLRNDARFMAVVTEADAAAFVAAALLHDVGHWAYCHPLEDMGLPEIPRHETELPGILGVGEIAAVLTGQWRLDPARVASLVAGTADDPAGRILRSLLSGPVDIDKMDYLARDSLHAGVPYGSHFDRDRLLASLCLDQQGTSLAITDKGRTAAELMVFARYVMFSEVYWHHAVRSATAMLQRAVWVVRPAIDVAALVRSDDRGFADWLLAASRGTPAEPLAAWLSVPCAGSSSGPARSTPTTPLMCTERSPAVATPRWPRSRRGWPRSSPAGSGGTWTQRLSSSTLPPPNGRWSSDYRFGNRGGMTGNRRPAGGSSRTSRRWFGASPTSSSTTLSSEFVCSPPRKTQRRSRPSATSTS